MNLGLLKTILMCVFLLSALYLPAEERGHTTELNGINLWWQDYGDSSHPPVLLIMGLNSNSKVWPESFIQGIVDEGFYVIAYDNRDIGKSTWMTEEPLLVSFVKVLPTFLIEAFVEGIFSFIFDYFFSIFI